MSVNGETRAQRSISSQNLWKWIDAHEKEFGVGRPYLDKDPAHVAPIDGKEYAAHRGAKALHAVSDGKERKAVPNNESVAKRIVKAEHDLTAQVTLVMIDVHSSLPAERCPAG